jgi:hypothetical protein
MEKPEHTKNQTKQAWWHWLVFGLLTPFFHAHGFRELSKRETFWLVVVSIITIVLAALGMLGYLNKW